MSKEIKPKVFELSVEDVKKIQEWDNPKTGHNCTLQSPSWDKERKYKYAGACGGHLSYHFVPTSIGTFVTVKCTCGAELDLSNI